MLTLLLCTVLAAAASLALMPRIIVRLYRRRVMDIPNQRSSHRHPVPRGGGLGVLAVLLAGLGLATLLGAVQDRSLAAALAGGALLLGLLGFLDDLYSLPALLRLVAQLLVAGGCLRLAGVTLVRMDLPLLGSWETGAAGFWLAALWVVGFTNMFNFMDGINGMAGWQAILGGLGLGLLGRATGRPDLALVGGLTAGATVGFLRWNFPRARVFLGDVGSLPLGFVLAMSVLAVHDLPGAATIPVWVPVLMVWPVFFDAGYTLVNRAVHRRNPFHAHRSHLYQRLVVAGASHEAVSLAYAAWLAVTAAIALWSRDHPVSGGRLFWVVVVVSLAWAVRTAVRVRASMTTAGNGGGH